MSPQVPGIHHVTAIAGNPQQNIDFYTGFLGLRLVKLTVNFDDPRSYHLYYGDQAGHPGTILTFFAWPGAPRGRIGPGQVAATAFSIPTTAVEYWLERLREHDIQFREPSIRFGREVLAFSDPDGLQLELVADDPSGTASPWADGPVPVERATRGFHGVTMAEADPSATEAHLARSLGFHRVAEAGGRIMYEAESEEPGRFVEVLPPSEGALGRVAVGTIHHVAWRAVDDAEQRQWQQTMIERGLDVTPIVDRKYFRSIYFHEPGGVLFEIATDPPGFTVDETEERLGTRLMLPNWLEPVRARIERSLPPIHEARRAA